MRKNKQKKGRDQATRNPKLSFPQLPLMGAPWLWTWLLLLLLLDAFGKLLLFPFTLRRSSSKMMTTQPEKNPVASHLRVGPDTTVRCVFIHANDRIIPLPVLDLCNIFVSDILKVLSEHGLETKVLLTCGTKPLGCHHNCSLAEYGVAFDSCIFVTPSDALPGGTKV